MIPKIIHISWKTRAIFRSQCFLVQNGLKNLIDINPDWDVQFSDDNDVDVYLKKTLPEFDYLLLKNKSIVEKIDTWRLVKLLYEGGVYIDIDRLVNIPFSNFITDDIKCVLPTYKDQDFSHDMMISAPNNSIFHDALNLNLARRREGHTSIYFLGPQTYMHAVTKNLLGVVVNSGPPIEAMIALRDVINKTPFAITYREVPYFDTMVFQKNEKFENFDEYDYVIAKRKLYEEFKMEHWSGEMHLWKRG